MGDLKVLTRFAPNAPKDRGVNLAIAFCELILRVSFLSLSLSVSLSLCIYLSLYIYI